MNRRGFLLGMGAATAVVAGELWVPGKKLISIPSGKIFTSADLALGEDITTLSIMETMPGDRVRVVARYAGEVDPVEYIVKNVVGDTITFDIPMRGQDGVDIETIVARPGDRYAKYVPMDMWGPETKLEKTGIRVPDEWSERAKINRRGQRVTTSSYDEFQLFEDLDG